METDTGQSEASLSREGAKEETEPSSQAVMAVDDDKRQVQDLDAEKKEEAVIASEQDGAHQKVEPREPSEAEEKEKER